MLTRKPKRTTDRPEGTSEQGKPLVSAIEALDTIEPTGPIESVITWLLLKAYRRRLWDMVTMAPAWTKHNGREGAPVAADVKT